MKVISKKAVSELFNKFYNDESMRVDELEILLIEACKELDPWLPIDENTPKDKRLNLYWEGYGWYTGEWRRNQFWIDAMLSVPLNIQPTHYKLLPEDPK